MLTNTINEIVAAFIEAMHSLVPTYEFQREMRWRNAGENSVDGLPDIRTFRIDQSIGAPVPNGLHGIGEEWACELYILTSYGALPQGQEDMVRHDLSDLRTAFMDLIGAAGLGGYLGIEDNMRFLADSRESSDRIVSGAHIFTVHYMHNTGVVQ